MYTEDQFIHSSTPSHLRDSETDCLAGRRAFRMTLLCFQKTNSYK